MHRSLFAVLLGLVPFALPVACVSLNKGEVVIVDENAGAPNAGGSMNTSGNAGRGTGGSAGTSTSGGTGGGTSGDAGEAGGGTGPGQGGSNGQGGSVAQGGSGGSGGSGNGDAGTDGGGGEPPTGCADISECVASAPICDDGTCRKCKAPVGGDPDECDAIADSPHCNKKTGRCVGCRDNSDCPAIRVCGGGVCRGCQEGSECDSGACNGGRCVVEETSIVYALAGGGSSDSDCGTSIKPCLVLSQAASKLTSARPYLVLVKTSAVFEYDVVGLPATIDIWVFGNHVTISGSDGTLLRKDGGNLVLEDVVFTASVTGSGNGFPVVDISNASLRMLKGSITSSNASTEYQSSGLNLANSSADIRQVEFRGSHTGLVSQPTVGVPAVSAGLTLERCLFENNYQALDVSVDHFVIRNNLFLANGLTAYPSILRLAVATNGFFAYNTLYGNDNQCNEGGLIVCGANCGVHSSNLFWGNMLAGPDAPCVGQVYGNPTPEISYTLAEQLWAGERNIDGSLPGNDPLLHDAPNGDCTPDPGSPAIDAGDTDTAIVPEVDYYGNPRPIGDGPDIGAIEVQ